MLRLRRAKTSFTSGHFQFLANGFDFTWQTFVCLVVHPKQPTDYKRDGEAAEAGRDLAMLSMLQALHERIQFTLSHEDTYQ